MRGLRNIIQNIQGIKASLIVAAFVMALSGVVGVIQPTPAKAASNDIVAGGIWGRDLGSKCGGDVGAIMAHYWIDCNLAGVVDGRVCRDNNVYVGDRVVASSSTSIGREAIQGSHAISIGGQTYYETPNSQALLQQCLDTFVKLDGNGSFKYAIIKACGNPIYSPSPVMNNPAPTPAPVQQIQPVTVTPSVVVQQVTYAEVCDITTGQTVKIDARTLDNTRYVDVIKCKPMTVCRLADYQMVNIIQKDFDTTKYSQNSSDCQRCKYNTAYAASDTINCVAPAATTTSTTTPTPAPALPTTGITDGLVGTGIGIGSLIIAGSAYFISRKDLLAAFLSR